ncbi:MAG: ornithine carbamoyltransferase [Acidobacteria bacterium]|nr:ornithine carbamoyltransferase [Acidobacteriota bacterium]
MAAAANVENWTMLSPDLKSDLDLTTEELLRLLDLAEDVKRNPLRYTTALQNRYLTLLFEKPSLRTRMTFEVAIQQLGGGSILNIGPIGDREPLKDIARNVERWTNGIVARVYSQQTIEDLAKWASVPVINALSDLYHPCQALADFQTIAERFGSFRGLRIAFAGDGNNVAHSLMLDAARLGAHFTIACPKGYEPDAKILAQSRAFAAETGATVNVTNDPIEGVRGADAVYTDVWASMGQEHEADKRRDIFMPYQVNDTLMEAAGPKAIFMHCLPAKRGLEVTESVIESPQSVVFDQAENRLHAQKALLLMLLSE